MLPSLPRGTDSGGEHGSKMADRPAATVVATIADLYPPADPRLTGNASPRHCRVNSDLGFSTNFPKNTRYIYQESPSAP